MVVVVVVVAAMEAVMVVLVLVSEVAVVLTEIGVVVEAVAVTVVMVLSRRGNVPSMKRLSTSVSKGTWRRTSGDGLQREKGKWVVLSPEKKTLGLPCVARHVLTSVQTVVVVVVVVSSHLRSSSSQRINFL